MTVMMKKPDVTDPLDLKYYSTGIDFIAVSGRRKGNSTRQIDKAIQDLFNHEAIYVSDHWAGEKEFDEKVHRLTSENLFKRIIRRIEFEHHGTDVIVDFLNLTIQITHPINGRKEI
jgi:hypothetical protein